MLKKTQSVYMPSLHPVLWDCGVPSHIYYSVGKTARTLGVKPNTIRDRARRKTVSFVRVNGRIFIPTYAIRLEKTKSNRPAASLPVDDLSLLMMMERGANSCVMARYLDSRVKEFWDLSSCLVVAVPRGQDMRDILAFRRFEGRVVYAKKEMPEEVSRQFIQDLFTSEGGALTNHFSPESWRCFEDTGEAL